MNKKNSHSPVYPYLKIYNHNLGQTFKFQAKKEISFPCIPILKNRNYKKDPYE